MTSDEDPALTEPLSALMERALSNPLPVSRRWKPSEHTKAVKQIVDALRRLPGWTRVRKRQVGRFIATDGAGNPRKINGKWVAISVAVKGDPDVECSWLPLGAKVPLSIAVEVKTGTGRLSDVQREKKAALEAGGWHFIVAATAAEAFEACLEVGRQSVG